MQAVFLRLSGNVCPLLNLGKEDEKTGNRGEQLPPGGKLAKEKRKSLYRSREERTSDPSRLLPCGQARQQEKASEPISRWLAAEGRAERKRGDKQPPDARKETKRKNEKHARAGVYCVRAGRQA